jgi:LPXTG-motif cell wall-anchored protein
VTIEQVNNCLNEADLDGDGVVTVVEKKSSLARRCGLKALGPYASSSASTAAEVQYKTASPSASASAATVLPETGGASLLALGAGVLLVAGGLVARRSFDNK